MKVLQITLLLEKKIQISIKKIITLLKSLNLYEFVSSLPDGLDTKVGEKVYKYQEVNYKELE